MKKLFTLIIMLGCLTTTQAAETLDPQANPNAVVSAGKARFTVLTPEMIRIQSSDRQLFEDRATFAVVNRQLPVPHFTKEERDGYLYITTDALTLKYKIGGIISGTPSADALTIQFKLNGIRIVFIYIKYD